MSLFLWYSIHPFYIELTSLYNQTSNSFQFLINAIIKTIGILSLFSYIEFLSKDIWHKHLSYEIKLSIKWLAYIISCSNELTCNVAILSNQSFQKHQQMPTMNKNNLYSLYDNDTMYTCNRWNKTLIKIMLTENKIK